MVMSAVARRSVTGRPPRSRPWITARLLAPATLYYGLFLVIPMAALVVLSFWHTDGLDLVPGFSFVNYRQLLSDSLYRDILLRTVLVGVGTAAVTVPVAFGLAYLLRFVFTRRAQLITQAVMITLFAGYLVRIYSWRTILGREGLLNSFLMWTGLVDQPLDALIYSPWAVIIILCCLVLPLAMLPLSSAFANIPRDHLEVARDLGSRRLHLVRTVLLPMAMPGVTTAFAFTFLLSAGDFVTPTLVGGTNGVMVGNVISNQFRGIGSNWPLGAALVCVTIAIVAVVYLIVVRLLRWWTRW